MRASRHIRSEVILTLIIWYGLFGLGDYASTLWLILNDPSGIANEANPAAVMLYTRFGLVGLLAGKVAVFIVFSTLFLILELRYSQVNWFREASESTLLGMIAYSLIVLYNNFLAIIAVQAFKGWMLLIEMSSVVKIGMVAIALALVLSLLKLRGLLNSIRSIEAVVGTLAFLVPTFLFDKLFLAIATGHPTIFLGYFLSVFIILSSAFYMIEELMGREAFLGKSALRA